LLCNPDPNAHHRFLHQVLARNNRNRVLSGAVAAVAEHGYPKTSVERIIAAAGVSRYAFYGQFPDKETCLLAAYDRGLAWLEQELTAALLGAGDWAEQVRIATARALALLAADLGVARLLATEILCIGPAGPARRRALVDRLIPLLRRGRAEAPGSAAATPRLELALASGAISLVGRELSAGRGERLAELAPDLAEFLLTPYLDAAPARLLIRGAPLPRPAPASR
jgi:AcrR family transcriptional regulator